MIMVDVDGQRRRKLVMSYLLEAISSGEFVVVSGGRYAISMCSIGYISRNVVSQSVAGGWTVGMHYGHGYIGWFVVDGLNGCRRK